MKDFIKSLFIGTKAAEPTEYRGLSDFFRRASPEEKRKVFVDAAHKANKDQLEIFKKAELLTKSN